MTDWLVAVIVAVIFTGLGSSLADNLTVIDCAKKGTAKLNGATIECAVLKEPK